MQINEYIDHKIAENPDYIVNLNEILVELGLEDAGSLVEFNDDANVKANMAIANIGSIYFRNPSHTSSYFNAELFLSTIGLDPLDLVFGTVFSYSNVSGAPGSYVLTGSDEWEQRSARIGVTSIGTYSTRHYGYGGKLQAVATIHDGGKTVVPSPADVIYTP
ncbi:hypothetical protein HF072_04415 [Bacillus sp. RO3]|nr:hypothetical protein [Bacillus sp. RO3]